MRALVIPFLLALLAACGQDEGAPPAATGTAPPASPAPDPAGPEPFSEAEIASALGAMGVESYARHFETLASDAFAGRMPATPGGRVTIEYLIEQFEDLGLEPGNGDSYRQAVPLVEITAERDMPMSVGAGQRGSSFRYGIDFMAWTKRVVDAVALEESPLVFVGYGIVAPEYGWDDYAGLDVSGKTVVMLVNDPGFATGDPQLFNGRAMTYYGRWTYKFEEAARQGAAGALIVHDTEAAGYPWEVVSGSWSGPQFDLARDNDNMDRVQVEGWLSAAAAAELFELAGRDLAALSEAAVAPGFEAAELDASLSIAIDNEIRRSQSYNVLAKLPGSEAPEEVFVYMAHWDHFGKVDEDLPPPDLRDPEDRIFNGAVDNASGTAALLELARAYTALPRAPRRTVLFLAVTAEESGLLGSAHYAANPVYPTRQTVAGINMDAMNVLGPTEDVVVIGYGNSEMDDYLRAAVALQGRELVREPTPEKGYFYRSDHFQFAKRGVPVLYAEGGERVLGREPGYGAAAAADYVAKRYHKVGDEFDPRWDLSGTLLDMELYFRVGLAVADGEDWPAWTPGNEFEAIREADLAQAD